MSEPFQSAAGTFAVDCLKMTMSRPQWRASVELHRIPGWAAMLMKLC